MDIVFNIFFLLVAIGVLVTFHEAGHFLIARWSGVHVVRFSVGFGPPLVRWRDRFGTEYCVAALPLGGYVRMFDRRELASGGVAAGSSLESTGSPDGPEAAAGGETARLGSFDQLTPSWRLAIALGGPGANFVLAFLLYWLASAIGVTVAIPQIGTVAADSPAARAGVTAGHEVVSVDGEATNAWMDVGLALASRLGESGIIEMETAGPDGATQHRMPVNDWLAGEDDPDTLAALGISPGRLAVVGQVRPDSPAARADLIAGDRITHIDGEPTALWSDLVDRVKRNPGQELRFDLVNESGVRRTANVTPEAVVAADGTETGQIGVYVAVPQRLVQYSAVDALARAADQTWSNTTLTLDFLAKMVTLKVSPANLSGPITIAIVAGDSARVGIGRFLSVLALLSISLGVLNLLPIPVLDGGQVLSNLVEMVRRKPLPQSIELMAVRLGIVAVVGIMLLAFYNDVTRWLLAP